MAAGHFLPNIGGVERYVFNLSKALIRNGSEVAVVASLPASTECTERIDGIDIFRLPCLPLGGGRLPLPVPFSTTVREQLDAVADWNPDIFVIHSHLFVSNLYAARLARRLDRPYVLINHGSGYVTAGSAVLNLGLKVYEHALASQIGRHHAAAFGVSLAAARWLDQFGIHTESVIANGVDTTSMPPRGPSIRARLGIGRDVCIIAFAARLLPEKGADTLLSAFKALDPQNAALVIAGDGPALQNLRAGADGDNRIHFLGACSHADVLNLFGAADIMAYPSRYPEGQPTTVLEAGAMGCAVIATPRGGTAELIDSPELGVIVHSQADLEAAMRHLINDLPRRQELGRALQEKVRLKHDWYQIATTTSAILETICADHQKAKTT